MEGLERSGGAEGQEDVKQKSFRMWAITSSSLSREDEWGLGSSESWERHRTTGS